MASLGRRPGAAPLTTSDIPDNSITAAKIVADTIAAGDIATGAVDTAELADDAVTGAKIENNPTIAGNLTVSGDIVPSTPLSHRNMIINGGMDVAQRATTASVDWTGYWVLDRYGVINTGAGVASMTQTTNDVPDGFKACLQLACTTADTSISATERFVLRQPIEAQNLSRIAKGTSTAKSLTLSFYVKGDASATYQVSLYDPQNNRIIGSAFSVTTAWNRVEITFAGDTAGALTLNNTTGLNLDIMLHRGTNYSGGTGLDAWSSYANTKAGALATTSFYDSTARRLLITGVQLELGSNATPFEHRSYAEELALCQRYYQKSYETGVAPGTNTNLGGIHALSWGDGNVAGFRFIKPMRDVPSVRFWTTSGTLGQIVTQVGDRAAAAEFPSETAISFISVTSGTNTNHNKYQFDAVAEL